MPVRSLDDIPLTAGADHPVAAVDRCKARRKQHLGDAVGIDQFGVNRVELDPVSGRQFDTGIAMKMNSVMVIQGELTLVTNEGEQTLRVGDCAGFKAGDENAHRLENRSDNLAVYLEVGSRRTDVDEVYYPDDDLKIGHDENRRPFFMRLDGTVICPVD